MDSKQGADRRKNKRLAVPAQASCTDWEMSAHFEAAVRNHGSGGVSLRTRTAFAPGTVLFLQTDKELNTQTGSLEKNLILPAEVVWCSQILEQSQYSHSVGVKFITPIL